jgi:hypothetical protein
MPPIGRPYPRFIADAPREKEPYGRWEERLTRAFAEACTEHAGEAGARLDPETIKWFPERGWGGRVYVPASGRASASAGDEATPVEYFGHVSFVRPDEDGEPTDLRATADFTDITAEDNLDWKIDLNDDVIGSWHSWGERGGDVTLVWGLPMVRGAVAATAELDGETLDQSAIDDGRFTLVAVDAVSGFGSDDKYLEIRLWDRRTSPIARESLYEADEEPDSAE